jgi:hypothetical protein
MRTKNVKKMETTSSLTISPVRSSECLRIKISNNVYLVSKQGIYQRQEIILNKPFSRMPMVKSVAMHLDYSGSFIFKGKLLTFDAICKLSYGPLGERLKLNVTYDNEVIGNYSAGISYMGGGSYGAWPYLKGDDWVLIFTFTSTGFNSKKNELLIEYYTSLVPDPNLVFSNPKRKSMSQKDISQEILDTTYCIEDLKSIEKIQWLIPVRDQQKNFIGKLSCCSYPGYERYYNSYYGDLKKILKMKDNYPFIAKSHNEDFLYTIEYEQEGTVERFFPWNNTQVSYTI